MGMKQIKSNVKTMTNTNKTVDASTAPNQWLRTCVKDKVSH